MTDPESRRNLAWKLNWWRQSELDGALLLGRIVGTVTDQELAVRLTRHCAEEAEHSRIWAEVIAELELPHVRIFRSYQSFYLQHCGAPATLLDVLCFTQVFERRVHTRFHEELRDPALPEAARKAYRRMIEDEKDHLGWVAAWLSKNASAQEGLARYREIDLKVFNELSPFEECLASIAGLGLEQRSAAAGTA